MVAGHEAMISQLLGLAKLQGKTLEASYSGIVGLVVAVLRTEKQWSQAYLAKVSQVSQPTISRIELGEADITVPQMDAISAALGTTPGFILGIADDFRRRLLDKNVKVESRRSKDSSPLKGAAVVAATGAILGGGPIGLMIGAVIGALITSKKARD